MSRAHAWALLAALFALGLANAKSVYPEAPEPPTAAPATFDAASNFASSSPGHDALPGRPPYPQKGCR